MFIVLFYIFKSGYIVAKDEDDDGEPDSEVELIEGTFDKFGIFNPPDEETAYDKVTIQPTPDSRLDGVFSTTDITQNDLQIIGAQQPGYINSVSIVRNQDVRQGEPINQTFSTNLKITKYKFDGNGLFYMQPDPNAPQTWVIPGAIEVAVQPPQLATNQIITTNGTYEIYDANPNQPGLEIEQSQQQRQILKLREKGETNETNEEDEEDAEKEDLIGTFTINVPTYINFVNFRYLNSTNEKGTWIGSDIINKTNGWNKNNTGSTYFETVYKGIRKCIIVCNITSSKISFYGAIFDVASSFSGSSGSLGIGNNWYYIIFDNQSSFNGSIEIKDDSQPTNKLITNIILQKRELTRSSTSISSSDNWVDFGTNYFGLS